jgi:hypothetical protein
MVAFPTSVSENEIGRGTPDGVTAPLRVLGSGRGGRKLGVGPPMRGMEGKNEPGGAERGVPGLDLLKGGGGAAKDGAFAELLAQGVGGSD